MAQNNFNPDLYLQSSASGSGFDPDEYLKSIINTVDHSKVVLFEGQGFVPWGESKGYVKQLGNHFDSAAHAHAADIISAHFGESP